MAWRWRAVEQSWPQGGGVGCVEGSRPPELRCEVSVVQSGHGAQSSEAEAWSLLGGGAATGQTEAAAQGL